LQPEKFARSSHVFSASTNQRRPMSHEILTTEAHLPGTNTARALLSLLFVQLLLLIPILQPAKEPRLAVWAAYALPLTLVAWLVLAIRLARQGSASASSLLCWLGILLICGGPAFDMTATLIHTPDLSREANPVVRVLLDSGHSLPFVFVYGAVGQGLYLSFLCVLWLALLRHRPYLLASVGGERTFFRFLKSATGGGSLTWRQWLLPLRWADLPAAYHCVWLLAVALWSETPYRVLLGLEWFGLVPDLRWQVTTIGLVVGFGAYFVWLWRTSRQPSSPKGILELAGENPLGPSGNSVPLSAAEFDSAKPNVSS
jgi:hypothetical protein